MVGWSIGPSVGRSVRNAFVKFGKEWNPEEGTDVPKISEKSEKMKKLLTKMKMKKSLKDASLASLGLV